MTTQKLTAVATVVTQTSRGLEYMQLTQAVLIHFKSTKLSEYVNDSCS